MNIRFGLGVPVIGLLFMSFGYAQSLSDDFNRPDSPVVGNGWSDSPKGVRLMIKDGKLTTDQTNAAAPSGGIFQTYDPGAATTLAVDLTPQSGYAAIPDRYDFQFSFHADGTTGSRSGDTYNGGYTLSIYRGDANYADSAINLYDNGVFIATRASDFQFSDALHALVTFFGNGEVVGELSDGSDIFDFGFGPHAIVSDGTAFTATLGMSDSRTDHPLFPTLDNLSLVTDDNLLPPDLPVDQPPGPGGLVSDRGAGVILPVGTFAFALLIKRRDARAAAKTA